MKNSLKYFGLWSEYPQCLNGINRLLRQHRLKLKVRGNRKDWGDLLEITLKPIVPKPTSKAWNLGFDDFHSARKAWAIPQQTKVYRKHSTNPFSWGNSSFKDWNDGYDAASKRWYS